MADQCCLFVRISSSPPSSSLWSHLSPLSSSLTTPAWPASFQSLTSNMPCFLPPSLKMWHSLLCLSGKLIPQIPLVHSLTFFRSVLKYHLSRQAFPNHSIRNNSPLCPSLAFLSCCLSPPDFFVYPLIVRLLLSLPSPSPLGTSHYLTEFLCLFLDCLAPLGYHGGSVLFR